MPKYNCYINPSSIQMESVYLIIFLFALIPAISNFSIAIYTVLYHHYIYQFFIRPKFDPTYQPNCTIIVPVKGKSPYLYSNLVSFLRQNYPYYQVIFTVESKLDPAVNTIKKITSKYSRAHLVIAGLASTCCQKNHNLIAATKKITNKTDVLVFADADIKLKKSWLREMILPLSDSKNTATTTWPISVSDSGTLGELTHVFMNSYTYSAFIYASTIYRSTLIWGGSIAIRFSDFKKLKIVEKWSHLAVDDTSLSKILRDNRHRTTTIPATICQSQKSIQNVSGSINWYVRQIMYLKLYRRQLYLTIFFFNFLVYTFVYFWLPSTAFTDQPTYYFFIPVIYIFGEMYTAYLYLYFANPHSSFRFVMLAPLYKFFQYLSFARTFFSYTIYWGGITYTTDRQGRVNNIKR